MASCPIKVLMISTIPLARNGQTLFILRLAGAFDPEKVQADFLTYRIADEALASESQEKGIRIFTVPHRLKKPLSYLRSVSKLVRNGGYDIVHIHGNSHTLVLDLLGTKLGGAKIRIAHAHNTQGRYPRLHRMLAPMFHHLYTHAFACGREAGQWLFDNHDFTVIPNAIDTGRFAFDAETRVRLRGELHLADSDIAIGCAAHFSEQKNHAFLIRAFAQAVRINPRLHLILAGDGILRSEAEHLAAELNVSDRIVFLGLRSDMPELLCAMDAMALPSLHEGFPTVALEWQCSGLPILLSDAVTKDCALTNPVRFLPLEENVWTKAMSAVQPINRIESSRRGIQAVLDAGYDLAETARRIVETYQSFIQPPGGEYL